MSKHVKFSKTDAKIKQMIKRKQGLSEKRIKTYDLVFKEIFELTGLTPSEILKIAKEEEKPYIRENNLVDLKDIDDRKITEIQYLYDDYLSEQMVNGKPLRERTKDLKMSTYRHLSKIRFKYCCIYTNLPIQCLLPKQHDIFNCSIK